MAEMSISCFPIFYNWFVKEVILFELFQIIDRWISLKNWSVFFAVFKTGINLLGARIFQQIAVSFVLYIVFYEDAHIFLVYARIRTSSFFHFFARKGSGSDYFKIFDFWHSVHCTTFIFWIKKICFVLKFSVQRIEFGFFIDFLIRRLQYRYIPALFQYASFPWSRLLFFGLDALGKWFW